MSISNNTTGLQRILNSVNALPKAGSGGGGGGIIDVLELPTENISESSFYRLMTATVVHNQEDLTAYNFICYCVDGLPEVGLPATNADMGILNIYYNVQDGVASGYIDEMLSAGFGFPVGWYEISNLLAVNDTTYGGTITDIDDDPCDDAVRLLLGYDYYIYKNEWMKLPFACEKTPEFDIRWDGDMTDRFVLDMSALGFDGIQLVKISDQSLTADQLTGSRYSYSDSASELIIEEDDIDTNAYPGGITVNNGEIVSIYSADDANAALGLPSGYLTNGLYFFYSTTYVYWLNYLIAQPKIVKIDSKFIDADINVDLSEYARTTDVETMINIAIGTAIGGSY